MPTTAKSPSTTRSGKNKSAKKVAARSKKSRPTKKSKKPKTASTVAGLNAKEKKAADDLVMQLMAIRGKSGEEADVAKFIRAQLKAAGAPAKSVTEDTAWKLTPIDGKTGNLIFKLPGTIKAPRRMLMAHMDTVPICVGCQPKKKGNFVKSADPTTGLGADDRAGVAVTLGTALHILKNKIPHPPLTFLWTVQEEIGLHGARHVKLGSLGKPKLAFNWDGGSPAKLTIGATGGYRMNIEIEGQASHAGNAPEKGISAIAIASVAIADLQKNGWHGLIKKRGKSGTTNVGVINGGAATNVVTDLVTIRAEARSHDPVFRKEIVRQIEKAFQSAVKQVKNSSGAVGKVKIEGRLDYESFRLEKDEPAVAAAMAAVKSIGEKPNPQITNGGVDANWLSARGIPTVTLGCGQMNPHMVTETLDLVAYRKACHIARILATAVE